MPARSVRAVLYLSLIHIYVENILLKIIQAADYNIERAQHGIIYIDEIDKISKKSENVSICLLYTSPGINLRLCWKTRRLEAGNAC